MLFGAWCGYGPGILVVVLAASVVPYLSNPDFSLNQIDPGGLAALVLLSVLVSRMAEGRRRRETLLLDVNAELDRRVQAQTAELERTNRSLEHQVAELETLYAKSPVGLSLLDKDLRFVRINEKLASINGSSVSDHQGRRLHEMVPKPIADVIGPLFRSVLETGAPILNYELQGLSSQPGAKRDWLIDCARVIAEDGSVIGLQIVVQDITERKRGENALAQANDELRQSEEQFRLLANAIPQLCWMANADGWIFWYNDRWYEYTGLTPARLAGWGWQEVHHPDFLPHVLARWELSIATGQPFEMVFTLRAADGAFRTFLTRVHPLKDAQGHVLRWFGTNTDITERKQIEDALDRATYAAACGAVVVMMDPNEIDDLLQRIRAVTVDLAAAALKASTLAERAGPAGRSTRRAARGSCGPLRPGDRPRPEAPGTPPTAHEHPDRTPPRRPRPPGERRSPGRGRCR
jgi:PAS domain S-box-containing protein